ncbi:hypothetical protein [Mycolicibacter minnesotensis]
MQQLMLRPYLTAGIAVAGAGIIAVAPIAPVLPATSPAPLTSAQLHTVQLANAWSDLFTNTTDNLASINANADWAGMFQVFTAMFTNPLGVLGAVTSVTPDVTTDLTSLPVSVSVQLPPALELLIANLASQAATLNAFNDVLGDLGNPATAGNALLNGPAVILDAYLNGQQNLSLLGGMITIPVFNGILAPQQDLQIELNLAGLLDALGLSNLDLSNLNVADLLEQLGLGDLTLGGLLGELGLGGQGLGDLLGLGSNITDLGGLLGFLGLGDLGLGSFSLTGILSGLGLDTGVDLNSLSLDDVLGIFGINSTINLGLGDLLTNLGFGGLVNQDLGDLLSGLGLLSPVLGALNSTIGGILNAVPGVGVLLGPLLNNVLGAGDLLGALNTVNLGDLLGGQSISETVGSLLGALGVSLVPGDLTIGGILEGLGFADGTGALTLEDLLGGLGGGLLGLDITGLLNGLNLDDLLGGLGLDGLSLNLADLVGDLSGLNLGDLLGDLGLGDLASVSIGSFGGMFTLLLEAVPGQILDALAG